MEQFQDRYVNLIAIIIPNDLTPYEINHCKKIMESLIKYTNDYSYPQKYCKK